MVGEARGERWFIGLMSGTSMDGIDVAAIRTDGRRVVLERGSNGFPRPLGKTGGRPIPPETAALLSRAKEEAKLLSDRAARPGCLAEAEAEVTRLHAEAVEEFLRQEEIDPAEVEAIGFHGQTVLHRPEAGLTVQLGDGQALADRLGIPVVYDFRAADVAGGGEGAPLVPVFHRALVEANGLATPIAVLNIGGVANVTFVGEAENALVGFDTGPGNALLNDLMRERTGLLLDQDGATAAKGRVDRDLLAWMMRHPFFARPAPKSLDRDAFSHRMVGPLPVEDAAATLTAFTASAIGASVSLAPERPRRWIVGGGGARNRHLMARLREVLGPGVDLDAADAIGWSTDHLEAQAFAFLAARSLAGEPLTYPGTTGVAAPTRGGIERRPRR